jgi:hypothetical protein
MKTLKLLVLALALLGEMAVQARSDVISLIWDWPFSNQDIAFNVYMSTNQGVTYQPAMTIAGTNLTANLVYNYTGEMWFYCAASNTVRRVQGAPSNVYKLAGVPPIPPNFRLLSITIGP